ncbi:MAG TPA: tail fiber domain-containing protein, partial [Alphaproteobacteria bacterium]
AAPSGGTALGWSTDGTHVWRPTGNVGIGTATPTDKLHVDNGGIALGTGGLTGAKDRYIHMAADDAGLVLSAATVYANGGTLTLRGKDSTYNGGGFEFYTGGTERMRALLNGNIGIGVNNPQYKLQVIGSTVTGIVGTGADTTQYGLMTLNGDGTTYLGSATSKGWTMYARANGHTTTSIQNDFGISFWDGAAWKEYFYIDAPTGYVGIGTSAPGAALSVKGDVIASQNLTAAAAPTVGTGVVLGDSGAVLIKRSGTGSNQHIAFYNNSAATPTLVGQVTTSGSATTYATSSDRRLKENIEDTSRGLEQLKKIEVKDFDFIATPDERIQGFIAQDLYKVYPEAVTKGDDGEKVTEQWGVDYGRLTPLLVKAIQEQQAQINELKAEIEVLKAAHP